MHEKVRVSVCLTVKANVTCLKPSIVFGGAKPECNSLNEEFKSKATIMTKWVNKRGVVTAHASSVSGKFSFPHLIAISGLIDCYATSSIRKVLNNFIIDTAIVPGECTAHIQTPDTF